MSIFRSALKILPVMAVSFPLFASDLTDASAPTLGSAPVAATAATSTNQNAHLFLQMQQLQQELQSLRNLVETQSQKIRQLESDNRSRYLDVDQRLSELSGKIGAGQSADKDKSVQTVVASSANNVSEESTSGAKSAYQSAYNLIKTQKFDQAISEFQSFTVKYSESALLPNAYYWLGELYMVKNMTEKAEQAFQKVIADFPENRKVPDASYKIGLVLARYGKMDQAKAQMELVLSRYPDTTAAKLADKYLKSKS